MMYNYSDLKDLKNIDKSTGRVYNTPGGTYPSITTMLGATADKSWLESWKARIGEAEAERIKDQAAERGTLVHDYLEQLYNTYNSPSLEQVREFLLETGLNKEKPFIQKMVKELIKHLLANKFKSISQEFVVWDNDLKLAGRCDGLGYWNGVPVVIDYKTARSKKSKSWIQDYFLQATFYTQAHNKLFDLQVNRFIILIAIEDGTTQIFTGAPSTYSAELFRRRKMFYNKNGN